MDNDRISTYSGETRSATPSPDEKRPKSAGEQHADSEVIVVDWDGPDDPANPKKLDFDLCLLYAATDTSIVKLAVQTEMGSDHYRLFIHIHQSCFLVNGSSCIRTNCRAIRCQKRCHNCNDNVGIRFGLR